MNITRLIASVGGYFYSTAHDSVFVHLYGANRAKLEIETGPVTITQTTDYPWNGEVELSLDLEGAAEFTLSLRVPGWASDVASSLNGETIDDVTKRTASGYLEISSIWHSGDRVKLDFQMDPIRLHAHPAVMANLGRVALVAEDCTPTGKFCWRRSRSKCWPTSRSVSGVISFSRVRA